MFGYRCARPLLVLVAVLALAAPVCTQPAGDTDRSPVDPAVAKAALPVVLDDFLLVQMKRNTTSHMGVEGVYVRIDKLMAMMEGTLEGRPSDHRAFRLHVGFGPLADRQAEGIRGAGVPRVPVDDLPGSVEVYDDTSRARSAMIDTSAQKMMMVQGGTSSFRITLMQSAARVLSGEAPSAAPSAAVDTGSVRRVRDVYAALPARAGQHELVEYELAESSELAEAGELAFSAIYADPEQPRGTRIGAMLVLPGDARSNRFIQQTQSIGADLRRDTTLAGRDATIIGTGTASNGVVSNDRALVLFTFDGYQVLVAARDRDMTEEDVIALASTLNLSEPSDE